LELKQGRLVKLMIEAGWPAGVGLNDKRKTSHRHFSLDGSRVHSYFTRGFGFFEYDPKLSIIVRGKTDNEARVAMVLARENASPRVYGENVRGPDGRLPCSVPRPSGLKGKPRRPRQISRQEDAAETPDQG
jgi:hypothetical protein